MSIICQTFVQNAWRSDLCSNCFKSLDDHSDTTSGMKTDRMSTPRYVPQAPSLYQSRGISSTLKWRLSEPLYDRVARRDFGSQTPPKTQQSKAVEESNSGKGILVKDTDRRLRSRSSVDFASEEALVIGYGGNDYDSDLSPWEMGSDDGSIDFDLLDDTDEDRKITKLTKNNTEFNSSNQNLLPDANTTGKSKKQEQKSNTVNNQVTKPSDKSLNILNCVTYNNDIQTKTEKKLNQYYFPSSNELQTSYLHKSGGHSANIDDNLLKNNKERSKLSGNGKVANCTKKDSKISEENCRNLLKNEFTPLNTRTYSFVSELNRNNTSSEHSSDSDYSTCRHTPGDSTDSESFQDAEDHARIEPVSSFLHGNYPKNLSPSAILELECDKRYDGGSSTSGDVSNLSDDSDAHDTSEVSAYKSKTARKCTENKKLTTKLLVESPLSQESRVSTEEKNSHYQVPTTEKRGSTTIQLKGISSDSETPTIENLEHERHISTSQDAITVKNRTDVVSISVDSPFKTSVHSKESDYHCIVSVASHKTVSENDVSSDSREFVTSKSHTNSNEGRTTQIKSSSIDFQTPTGNNEENQKKSRKSSPPKNLKNLNKSQKLVQSDEGAGKQQNCTSIIKYQSDDGEEGFDCEASPDTIAHRQSKLAALALELELARRDSTRPNSINIPPTVQNIPPPVKTPSTPNASCPPEQLYPTIRKSGSVSCSSRLAPLPDVLQETPTKTKKSRFSLKKLLKRNKDNVSFSTSNKETNPKAWKKQSFDRSRLSLEIVHPMDLTNDPVTSGESSPVDDSYRGISTHPGKGLFKNGYSRTKSLSALPQISLDSADQGNCSLIDCRKVETLPSRKAGTVAERKKSRPSLVRTPSCSALPNRSQPTTPSPENDDRTPPPKPPPPPKYKAMQPPPPPPPPHQLRCLKTSSNSPARPPPPKIPEGKLRDKSSISDGRELSNYDKEYANLGDIRSQLIPKKPQRPSAVSAARDSETEQKRKNFDDLYETLQVAEEEEDHYTYLDETEVKTNKGIDSVDTEQVSRFKTSNDSTSCGRPWLDLQTSYSAIAATNYESLAEIITTAINESPEYLRKAGKSLKFKDFTLKNETPQIILHNRVIYNGVYKNQEQDKITLMVIPRHQNTPPPRNQTRYPVLANFNDHVPRYQSCSSNKEVQFASVYVLQSSQITTILQFSKRASTEKNNQHVHLQNYCFILLQLIHTLKSLQAEGIEEVHFDLDQLILVATHEDKPPIFVLFPEDKNLLTFCDTAEGRKTLCQATLLTMYHFLQIKKAEELKNCSVNGQQLAEPVAHTFKAIAKVLMEEKASSLSQAKGYLEYMLWGPVDVKVSDSDTEDTILQRWLDLQRAQMVKSTISQLQPRASSHTNIHIFEEYQLIFLLQASVKSLKTVVSKL